MIKVGLAQLNFCVGDIAFNRDKIISAIKDAKKKNIDLLAFPELAVTGYPPQDLLLKKHFITSNLEALKAIAKHTKDIIVAVGFVQSSISGEIFNACALLQDKQILDFYQKNHLPNYGVFDEKRYFSPGVSVSAYNYKGYHFSVNICEDLWNSDFVASLAPRGFDFLINIAASPFHLRKFTLRKNILSSVALKTNTFIFYCNLIGGQDDLVFDGGSMVLGPDGKLYAIAPRFEEKLLTFTISPKKKYKVHAIDDTAVDTSFNALCLGIRDYVKKNNFRKVIVGLSGGIDSAVVVSLAVFALGKENVTALLMPSRYTQKETYQDALALCDKLGIKNVTVSIEPIFEAFLKSIKPFFGKLADDTTEENLQARIRGNILMSFSNKFGYLVLNTGNKSELSCGYCTLYGDMVGGFGVLSDIPKTLVYLLADYINTKSNKEYIPQSIITRPPSAELRFNQKDTDSLPPYDVLDPVLRMYIEEDKSLQDICANGVDCEIAEKIIKMVDRNEYKRRQAPLGIKITPRAFGRDRRMPITCKFSG